MQSCKLLALSIELHFTREQKLQTLATPTKANQELSLKTMSYPSVIELKLLI